MRELVGFAAGLVAGAAAAVAVSSEAGRRVRERLVSEAEPDVRDALAEWDPLLREIARAVKLGVREVEAAADRVSAYLVAIADEGTATAGTVAASDDATRPTTDDASALGDAARPTTDDASALGDAARPTTDDASAPSAAGEVL